MKTIIRRYMGRAALPLLVAAGFLATVFLATSCTSTVSHRVSADGVPGEVVFPEVKQALHKKGISPNEENLKKIRPGMGKQDLHYLLGPPHFREVFASREWDYIFRFVRNGEEQLCQYKVVFDSKRIARNFYWQPKECGEGFFASGVNN
ncbi:MAG: outer membrane protein assembly factor BamE [Desulfobulbaceae bacterium]|nr:outer membrane protein assembly factor BamE [Desulfobulbaceae bacterium]